MEGVGGVRGMFPVVILDRRFEDLSRSFEIWYVTNL